MADFREMIKTSSPLELWAGGIGQIAWHAEESGIHAEFPQLAARFFQQAMEAGKKYRPCSKCCRSHLERMRIYKGARERS
jgi:hypothetical protein